MKKYAVIEIGSNAIKYLSVVSNKNKKIDVKKDDSYVTRLTKNKKDNLLCEKAINLNLNKIWELVFNATIDEKIKKENISIVATASLRNVDPIQLEDFLSKIENNTKIPVRILSGDEEAHYSCKGIQMGTISDTNFTTFDTGGGSTEFAFYDTEEKKIINTFSLPIGAVKIMEHFFDPFTFKSKYDINQVLEKIEELFFNDLELYNTAINFKKYPLLIGTGGGPAFLGCLINKVKTLNPSMIHNTSITKDQIYANIIELNELDLKERLKIAYLKSDRADIIVASSCIIYAILKILNKSEFIFSNYGLRYAILSEMIEKN